MKQYEFTIVASGLDPDADDFEDRFFEAGCDDATIAFVKGRILVEFQREAHNFGHALASAISDVRKAGAAVQRIEPDTLVNLSDIAERSGLTRSAASLYAQGKRGDGFPAPVARVTTESPLWNWVEVARWMFRRRSLRLGDVVRARMVQDANRAIRRDEGRLEPTAFGQKLVSEMNVAA